MTCPSLHVHAPEPDEVRLVRTPCTTCLKRRYMVASNVEWYGWGLTCLFCGERWEDGERLDRPFKRGWRQDSVDAARKHYRWWRAKP